MQNRTKRKHVRSTTEIAVCAFDTANGEMMQGATRNISAGGMFVETSQRIRVGTLMQFFLGGLGGQQVVGRVVHSTPEGFGAVFSDDDVVSVAAIRKAAIH
jgi:hypothetical protein